MQALAFWKAVAMDQSNFLEGLIGLLGEHKIRYCVIGGQGVNAYAEPLVSLDLDLVVAVDQLEEVERLLGSRFHLERFPYSLNVSEAGLPIESPDSDGSSLLRFPGTISRARRFRLAPACRFDRGCINRQTLGGRGSGAAREQAAQGFARYRETDRGSSAAAWPSANRHFG